ncbi:MAG TPA: pyruvate carboxylase subunit B [Candidatus Enterenecus stercoripullorum]|nr:pyruvate carboxylase subunit B [Candidatus Enterenecus stercoripullorum]
MKIHITETMLRDANQSLIATRMPLKDFQPILEVMDQAGYASLECWGGATFDSCLRYLDEDPWERLRTIRKHVKHTRLQMLLRGQNLLGYKHYPDDIVRKFVRKSVENGIDVIRIFDALNDLRNIEVAVDEARKAGAQVQGALCYTTSPIHSLDSFVELGKDLEAMGCHSVCIKDMAGIMTPKVAYELVTALKKHVKLPIVVHTHSTTGLASMTLLKAAEAGADTIDCAISCFSGGTSQPPTESMHYALKEMGLDTGLREDLLKQINDYFKPIQARALKSGLLTPIVMTTETDALTYQIPGGMLSNLVAQLTAQNALDRLPEVLEETPRVRADLGYPPLVTPSSQMVGAQAVANVLAGQRYKNVSKEIKAYLRGEYGRAPGTVSEELRRKVLGGEPVIEGRFADTLKPGYEVCKAEIGALARSEEDVLSYALFPVVAKNFFQKRLDKESRTVTYSIRKA